MLWLTDKFLSSSQNFRSELKATFPDVRFLESFQFVQLSGDMVELLIPSTDAQEQGYTVESDRHCQVCLYTYCLLCFCSKLLSLVHLIVDTQQLDRYFKHYTAPPVSWVGSKLGLGMRLVVNQKALCMNITMWLRFSFYFNPLATDDECTCHAT